MDQFTIVKETVQLPNPNAGTAQPGESAFYPTDYCFGFNLRFPEHFKTPKGVQASLPPTYTSWSPGMTCEVSYFIKVDVVRKGLRRHEEYVYTSGLGNVSISHIVQAQSTRPLPSKVLAYSRASS